MTAVNITEEKLATLTGAPESVCIINDQIWCCCTFGCIGVFDLTLNHVHDMHFPDMGALFSAVDVGDGAAVAATKGVFVVSYAGKKKGVYFI